MNRSIGADDMLSFTLHVDFLRVSEGATGSRSRSRSDRSHGSLYRLYWNIAGDPSSSGASEWKSCDDFGVVPFDDTCTFSIGRDVVVRDPVQRVLRISAVEQSDASSSTGERVIGNIAIDLRAHLPQQPRTTSTQQAELRMFATSSSPSVRAGSNSSGSTLTAHAEKREPILALSITSRAAGSPSVRTSQEARQPSNAQMDTDRVIQITLRNSSRDRSKSASSETPVRPSATNGSASVSPPPAMWAKARHNARNGNSPTNAGGSEISSKNEYHVEVLSSPVLTVSTKSGAVQCEVSQPYQNSISSSGNSKSPHSPAPTWKPEPVQKSPLSWHPSSHVRPLLHNENADDSLRGRSPSATPLHKRFVDAITPPQKDKESASDEYPSSQQQQQQRLIDSIRSIQHCVSALAELDDAWETPVQRVTGGHDAQAANCVAFMEALQDTLRLVARDAQKARDRADRAETRVQDLREALDIAQEEVDSRSAYCEEARKRVLAIGEVAKKQAATIDEKTATIAELRAIVLATQRGKP